MLITRLSRLFCASIHKPSKLQCILSILNVSWHLHWNATESRLELFESQGSSHWFCVGLLYFYWVFICKCPSHLWRTFDFIIHFLCLASLNPLQPFLSKFSCPYVKSLKTICQLDACTLEFLSNWIFSMIFHRAPWLLTGIFRTQWGFETHLNDRLRTYGRSIQTKQSTHRFNMSKECSSLVHFLF